MAKAPRALLPRPAPPKPEPITPVVEAEQVELTVEQRLDRLEAYAMKWDSHFFNDWTLPPVQEDAQTDDESFEVV